MARSARLLNTTDVLPGVGPATMKDLAAKKLVAPVAGSPGTYTVTEEGRAEAVRIVKR